jgi:predicted enzyme related to lactoylglutathione lyase
MPTRDEAWPQGTPCWVDLGVDDVDAARTFYTQLFRPDRSEQLTPRGHAGRAAAAQSVDGARSRCRWSMPAAP